MKTNTIQIKFTDERFKDGYKWEKTTTTDDYWEGKEPWQYQIMIKNIINTIPYKKRKKITEIYYNGERIK